MKRLNIGITIGLTSSNESLWTNGIKQNALFLLKVLQACEHVHHVRLLNTSQTPITDDLPWSLQEFPTVFWDDGKHDLDVVIELGAQIGAEQTEFLRERGTKLVSYCCGSEYVMAVENMLFNRTMWNGQLFVNRHFDELWFIPQVAQHTLPFLSTLRRAPAYVVPFVWDPMFIEQAWVDARGGVADAPVWPDKLRLGVMEPNLNTVKTCVMPILAAEHAFRTAPESIESLTVCNAMGLAFENTDFQQIMHQLDIVNAGKVAFTGRHDSGTFLAQHVDAIISHQWGNPLNYFYLDVAWLGYPLIHNAQMCADIGSYYADFDIEDAARKILELTTQHAGSSRAGYRDEQRRRLLRFTVANRQLVQAYDRILERLMAR